MYYAPVQVTHDPYAPVFKNVYCALCNDVNVSRLSCSRAAYVPVVAEQDVKTSPMPGVLKPVTRTSTCYARHCGRCYIRRSRDVSSGLESSGPHHGIVESDESVKLHSPVSYRPELQRKYSLQHTIAFICTSISIFFIVLKILVFCTYKEARRSSSVCNMCLAVTLLVAQVLFLVTKCVRLAKRFCFSGAVFAHYCFLSTFLWTCVLSYDISKSLTAIKLSSARSNALALYCLLAWGAPLLVVIAALTVNQTAPDSVLSPSYGDPICFIGSFWGLVVYFFLPMVSLVLFCITLYFKTVCYIRTTSSATECADDAPEPASRSSVRHGQQRANLALFVRLALVMGAPWAVALTGSFIHSEIVDCVVNLLVGSQGVYLFLVFRDYRYIWSSLRKGAAKAASIINPRKKTVGGA
ncbi:hypothetical protein HPB50_005380 [Hyalomma asiaticum]|uniref:Uncharacterized protein n=1 Tax=Hyalomma asiaticum TaxID=266040 RepID=A0ACB7RHV4_HYAAI|nr:hypothetical protein HPB50_005380 [Hyalomma asiaticum]